jgi:glycosyltransferase involved in cell wall biosynthesis
MHLINVFNGLSDVNLEGNSPSAQNVENVLNGASLSIVIPARNEQDRIENLLEKLIAEIPPYLEVEIIIANNSDSADQTQNIVQDFQNRNPQFNIKLINTEFGVSNARNGGADQSKNDYILFLDADICFAPGFVKAALVDMLKNGFDLAGVLIESNTDNLVDCILIAAYNQFQSVMKHTSTPFCTGAALLVRRNVHQQIGGFDAGMIYGEDADYAQKVVREGKVFGFLPQRVIYDMTRFEKTGRFQLIRIYVRTGIHYLLTKEYPLEMIKVYRKSRSGRPYGG